MKGEIVAGIGAGVVAAILVGQTIVAEAVLPAIGLPGLVDVNLLHLADSPSALAWPALRALQGVALAMVLPGLWRRLRPNAPVLTWLIVALGTGAAASFFAGGLIMIAKMLRLAVLFNEDPYSVLDSYFAFLGLLPTLYDPPTITQGGAVLLTGWVGWRTRSFPGWVNVLALLQAAALVYLMIIVRATPHVFTRADLDLIVYLPWYIGLAVALYRPAPGDSSAGAASI